MSNTENGTAGQPEYPANSAGAVVAFCDWLVAKNMVKEDTVANWRRGFVRVMEDVEGEGWEHSDIGQLDHEQMYVRFEKAAGTKYKPGTLAAYKKRFALAIAEYERWQENRSGYQPSTQTRQRRRAKDQNVAIEPASTEQAVQQPAQPAAAPSADMLEYPFPVRQGVVAKFLLPTDLRPEEAERISAFIASVAVSTPAALPSGVAA